MKKEDLLIWAKFEFWWEDIYLVFKADCELWRLHELIATFQLIDDGGVIKVKNLKVVKGDEEEIKKLMKEWEEAVDVEFIGEEADTLVGEQVEKWYSYSDFYIG